MKNPYVRLCCVALRLKQLMLKCAIGQLILALGSKPISGEEKFSLVRKETCVVSARVSFLFFLKG